jgi:hypothetical protein
MDLRLPSLPNLPPPNLLTGPSHDSVSRVVACGSLGDSAPVTSTPPYLEKLLHLQKLQSLATASHNASDDQTTAFSQGLVHQHIIGHQPGILAEISGAELAPVQVFSCEDLRHSKGLGSPASISFLEIDEQ